MRTIFGRHQDYGVEFYENNFKNKGAFKNNQTLA